MKLVNLSEENFSEIIALKTEVEKLGYVDSVLYSLAECFLDYRHMNAFGIYSKEGLIGFTSIFFKDNFGQIINFFIRDDYQNKSYGSSAVEVLVHMFKEVYKVDFVSVGIHKGNIRAFGFWKKLGFIDTGNIEGDYWYFRKPINKVEITNNLYLAKYFPAYKISLAWYKDKETVKMVDNSEIPYDLDKLKLMYDYLDKNGDLYYIIFENKLIGDCAIFDDNVVAIVISKEYRGKGIGHRVLEALIKIGKEKNLPYLKAEIYDFNEVSKKLFLQNGFKSVGDNYYRLSLYN